MSALLHPTVSIVIASVNGQPAIGSCLEALSRQEGAVAAEILVVDRCGESLRGELVQRFPHVRVLARPAGSSIPALRAVGLQQARGHWLAILEDHCIVGPRWLLTLERTAAAGHVVFGGPVQNGSTVRAVDWAAFLCEYARFMPPVERGAVAHIAGNNCVYARSVLERLRPELEAGLWESFWHARLRRLGVPFFCEPDLLVEHDKSFGLAEFARQRYHYSRSFTAMRLRDASGWRRAVYALATPGLPLLLLARLLGELRRKPGYARAFLRALPSLLVFLPAWAWGEAVGACAGPGRSLELVQ